ncbi:MAG: tRNA pseudouridine(13) synthase TruD, partial [Cyanobacteriota bacterium]|nr:tRNA pseudouridine(13) synthase TruD [Cyanobacteriota bacterium]
MAGAIQVSLPVWPPVEPLCGRGLIRQVPEDFVVEERVDIELEGEGEHLWVQLRKRGQNTEYVAAQLARLCEVPRRAVGYAGRKDRHAVTTQWFSVHLPGKQGPGDWTALPESVEVLQTARHRRKLQTGALKANRFRLVIRDLTGEPDQIESRLERLARRGVPNYFGEQRFGHGGRNVERAHEWFAGEFRPRDRSLRSLLLSSARSFLFNEVLAARVRADSWDRVLPGEVL